MIENSIKIYSGEKNVSNREIVMVANRQAGLGLINCTHHVTGRAYLQL